MMAFNQDRLRFAWLFDLQELAYSPLHPEKLFGSDR
jgi:hypothetical protein